MGGVSSTSVVLRDLESAERELCAHFPDIRLGRVQRDGFRSRFATTVGPRFSMMDYAFEAAGTATAGSDDLIVIASRGTGYHLTHGRAVVETSQSFLAPAEGLAGRWESFDAKLVRLDLAEVERIARSAAGDPAFRLVRTGTAPISAEHARHWRAVVAAIERITVETPDSFDSPLVADGAFHHLATAFLHAFDTSWTAAAEGRTERHPGSAVVRRALEFMHANAAEPITVQQIADAAFISTRGLHYAFTRDLGATPREVLRRLRLDRARSELRSSDGTATVAGVARRWGFANPSRFAEAYRRAFGESPAQTLRR